jgi:UDP-3-O-[3-hydroxymyristoyl] N-acetylglucosamine deacetylase
MDRYSPQDLGRRRTLKAAIGCVGVGVHSGQRVSLSLQPGKPGTGIVFRRQDLGGLELAAHWDNVVDTRLCTVLGDLDRPELRIGTVEHVMAALAGCGIDDAVVELDGPEVPILDGSAAPFVFLIDCAGTTTRAGRNEVFEVLRPIRVQEGDAWAELTPNGGDRFEASFEIEFGAGAIGRQRCVERLTPHAFRTGLADARTFALAEDVERLRAAGLALGGNLTNAVVVEGDRVLNPGGLRRPDEFVRHKLLDAVGDLALAGAPLRARFTGYRSGHALNNRLLRSLFADRSAWRLVSAALVGEGVRARLPAAAAPAML